MKNNTKFKVFGEGIKKTWDNEKDMLEYLKNKRPKNDKSFHVIKTVETEYEVLSEIPKISHNIELYNKFLDELKSFLTIDNIKERYWKDIIVDSWYQQLNPVDLVYIPAYWNIKFEDVDFKHYLELLFNMLDNQKEINVLYVHNCLKAHNGIALEFNVTHYCKYQKDYVIRNFYIMFRENGLITISNSVSTALREHPKVIKKIEFDATVYDKLIKFLK